MAVKRVLIVDDEPSILVLASVALRRHGYEAVPAAGPREALEIFRHAAPPIDLVVSDVVMPEMRGPDLVNEIRRLSPSVRVLFMSGFTNPEGVPEGADFLAKPFTLNQLAEKVNQVLAGSAECRKRLAGEMA